MSGPLLVVAAALAVVLSGCGGGTSQVAGTATTPYPSPQADDVAAIRQHWSEFFDAGTALDERVRLLQGGDRLRMVLRHLSQQPAWRGLSAHVESVLLSDADHAVVAFSLARDGRTVLAHQHGQAVLVDGTWQVATPAFCVVLALQGAGPTPCPSSAPTAVDG